MAEVVGVGALLADQIIKVGDNFLEQVQGKKGGMERTTPDLINRLIELSGSPSQIAPGGSAANVLRCLSHFGRLCALVSKTGSDEVARELAGDLANSHISLLGARCGLPTGRVLSIVTPDGQRTMRTYLGASSEWLPDDLDSRDFAGSRLVHIEGYTLLHPGLSRRAMKLAKEAGAQISFDLSSFEVTARHKDEIIGLMTDYVDIIFANEDEARMLTGNPPQTSCSLMKDICRTAIVTMGPMGCWVGHEGSMYQCPAYPVDALDTTGAGDLFTGGFLHGMLDGLSLPECAHIGAVAGRAVVQLLGTTIPAESWDIVKREAATQLPLG